MDLSSPEGFSVNDGIREELCTLTHVSVDDAARAVVEKGRGAGPSWQRLTSVVPTG